MNENEIFKRLEAALNEFFAKDEDLLKRNASERAVAARLAVHIGPRFSNYDVDVEYDRHGLEPKTLELPADCRGGGVRRVIPDVVIHQRGNDERNLVAIEIKKHSNPESRECDRAKLRAMRRQLRYSAAVLIDLPTGPDAKREATRVEWL